MSGIAGYFDDSQEPADDKTKNLPDRRQQRDAPLGFGGHDDNDQFREKGALPDLCAAAVAVDIGCSLRVYPGYHTWQFSGPGILECVAVAGEAGAARLSPGLTKWLAQQRITADVASMTAT